MRSSSALGPLTLPSRGLLALGTATATLAVAFAALGAGAGSAVGPASLPSPEPVGAPADGEGCRPPWVAPVDAPVTDPFRAPDHRYGPGNRGIEYGTDPGDEVVAVAAGLVDFAGPVAGRPVIVISHGGGLRSSYVNLLDPLVGRGHVVVGGQPIAVADAHFHLGVRHHGHYIDPAPLLGELCTIVRLVPI